MRDYWYVYNPNTKVLSDPFAYEQYARDAAKKMMPDTNEVFILHCTSVVKRVISADFGDPQCAVKG